MSTQIWLVCSGPQSDQDRLPFHYTSQSQGCRGEARDGHHACQPEAQPVRLLPQLHELRGLLCEQQAQPDRTSKPPFFLELGLPGSVPPPAGALAPLVLVLSAGCGLLPSAVQGSSNHATASRNAAFDRGWVYDSAFQILFCFGIRD